MAISNVLMFGMVDFSGLLDKFGIDWHLLLIQSLNFVLVAFLLYRFGFRSVARVMDERREKIELGLKYADDMKREKAAFESSRAQRAESARREAEGIVKSAKDGAKAILEQGKMELQQQSAGMILNAEKEIARRRKKILGDAKAEIGTLVVEVAKSVLASQMTDRDRNNYAAMAEKMLP
ncbi:MAG: F0F1 ATP synthase subunit B [Puniceicoccales bacterium]|jgi:F-type H+-transporting ATPase subunit b|nr:F0F1 ATP synthase subunit B [Puniceicoccales bacterium]